MSSYTSRQVSSGKFSFDVHKPNISEHIRPETDTEWKAFLTSTLAFARPLSFFVSTSYDKTTDGSRAVRISVHMMMMMMNMKLLLSLCSPHWLCHVTISLFLFFPAVSEEYSYRYLEAEREIPHKGEMGQRIW